MDRRSTLNGLFGCAWAATAWSPAVALAQEAVAEVLGRSIYRDELQGPGTSLNRLIIPVLMQRFAAEQHLVATKADVEDFEAEMGFSQTTSRLSGDELARLHAFSEHMVLDWKVSKALYERYGGQVIFQQANPLEPVGAVRRFLEDMEKAGAFRIFGASDRDRFYEYYVRQHPMVIPPSEVSYDAPWWRKK